MSPHDLIEKLKALRAAPGRIAYNGLSSKLLLLTISFVMLAEVLIFVPSVSNFRKNWLMERLAAAQIASLAVSANPGGRIPKRLREELLKSAQVHSVALKRDNKRELILQSDKVSLIDAHYNLRDPGWFTLIVDALAAFFQPENRMIHISGEPGFGAGEIIDIVISEAPLKQAMIGFGLNILGLSILISAITAALVYFALNALLVRPITQLTRSIVRFSENPEDPERIVSASNRQDEIGTAQQKLAAMQQQLNDTLQQKSRLAALGLAVSKINHDLRNILANAQLVSDHLGTIKNPTVQKLVPKLVKSLDRAIRLCTNTLKYGRSQETPPRRSRFALQPLLAEIGDSQALPQAGVIDWDVQIDDNVRIDADRDQLFRIFVNLVRNARQAIEARETVHADAPADVIAVKAWRQGPAVIIDISDSGPGIPARAKEHLFDAFRGSARKGGNGLGLAIAAELVRAHGGSIELRETAESVGTTFCIKIPDRVAELGAEARRSA